MAAYEGAGSQRCVRIAFEVVAAVDAARRVRGGVYRYPPVVKARTGITRKKNKSLQMSRTWQFFSTDL
jgi:hypothetical protein